MSSSKPLKTKVSLLAGVRRALGVVLGSLWFDIFRIRRQVVLDNLNRAFPEWSEKERVKVARRSLWNLGHNFVDYICISFLSTSNVKEHFEFHGLEHFDQALAKKKGVLVLTLHLGHGDLACAALSLSGYPMVMVSKSFKIKWLNDLWFGMREKKGTQFIPARDSSFQLLRALKNNKAVIIPLDQFTGPPIGVRTTFFKHETGTAAGLATMAQRSKAEVLPMYTYRDGLNHHIIQVLPAVPVSEDVKETTQRFNQLLEQTVRSHPEQWMWIHKRWKRFVE